MGKEANFVPVKFSYTNNNGQSKSSTIYVQKGMDLVFKGEQKAEQGKYHIGSDGAVYNEKGDKIDLIQTTTEQIAALEGMSKGAVDGVHGNNWVLSEADIYAAMTEKGGINSSLNVNMRQNAYGGNKYTHYDDMKWDTGTNPSDGVYSTRLTGEGVTPSYVEVSSETTRTKAEQDRIKSWKEEHPIKNWINENVIEIFDMD